ncbi:succinylglutamate desuccinylase/aspartoacylase family protein [Thermonema rossianum]|uniref:succinylglutamate desuccinylase/aspartoacylase family protein n=1 Tax=Thermonema rossianum TaxID=55505 RepID=UPI000571F60B|nr:succinylglutamate desuccinylase/aspartoacylase family protein [Thermonema rossianum]
MIDLDDILPGQFKRIDIEIERLPSHTLIDMPVFIYKGKAAGPTLLLTAGIHGDEINGIAILRRLIAEERLQPDAGTVIAIPLVNIYGFLQGSRTLPDGKDLNRSFPGAPTGSLARRIAHVLMNEIVPHIDFGVDFHTGGKALSNFPQLRCVFKETQNVALAKAFAPPFILNSGLIEGSFRKAAAKLGKPVLVYEGGESSRIDKLSVEEGIAGVMRLMHRMGMITGDPPPPAVYPTKVLQKTSWLRARTAGIFHSLVEYGDYVKKGQRLAEITDPYGSVRILVKAPHEGYIIGLNNNPVVNAGDALIHLGYDLLLL